MSGSVIANEIQKRRTFAIISHPDAGKTTLTEKLLLFGGAIKMAGTVKAKRSKKFATSDWMELEKKRGISVSSSVMNFPYQGFEINLIDTPGHEDFSEDTYRTLSAVDSVLMLIDAANGVETQTKKLFEICRMRQSPILTFINKLDREGRDPFELLEEIENVLGIKSVPITWPIGMGPTFKGVYHRETKVIHLFDKDSDQDVKLPVPNDDFLHADVVAKIGEDAAETLAMEIELLDGAGDTFTQDDYLSGKVAPVFFGSALNSFGIQPLLDSVCKIAPGPLPRETDKRLVAPDEPKFSAVIFKIQANMDPSHRDRVAFMRICSGRFERGMKAFHVRMGREHRLGRPTQFMAQDRSLVDEAFAGDIVGIHDPGLYKIGDTLTQGESHYYKGVPVFAPEHFVRVGLADPLKSKQLHKGLDQLSEEGAVQVFRPITTNDQILGVVGVLQFDVVKFRIAAEYGVNVNFSGLPFGAARWVHCDDEEALNQFVKEQGHIVCKDQHENYAVLLENTWKIKFLEERYPKVTYSATSENILSGV